MTVNVLFPEICSDRELRLSFTSHEDNNVYPVYMYDATNNSTATINTMLVERGFASMRYYGTNILGTVLIQCLVCLNNFYKIFIVCHKL